MTEKTKDYITAPQVAERIGMSAPWVYANIDKIPHYRPGNGRKIVFDAAQIDAWLEQCHNPGTPIDLPADKK